MVEAKPIGKQVETVVGLLRGLESKAYLGAVLSATQILANDLDRCLVVRMPSLGKKLKKKLFGGYGPFSTFSAKIDIAFAMDIIDRSTFEKLHAIRDLRNSIAHGTDMKSPEEYADWEKLSKFFPEAIEGKNKNIHRFMQLIEEIDDCLERFLVANGVTEDIRAKNLQSAAS